MKKITTIVAIFMFSIASAQSDNKMPTESPENPAKVTPEVIEETRRNPDVKNAAVNSQDTRQGQEGVDARKAEVKTRGHVKSSQHDRIKDTVSRKKAHKVKRS